MTLIQCKHRMWLAE